MKNMLNYMESNDIYSNLNTNILEDPYRNYGILHEKNERYRFSC